MDPLAPVRALDRLQRRRGALGFPLAVLRKYADDGAGSFAALIAYYGFFSLFPLLLVLTTILGYLLRGDQDLYDTIVTSALGQFPVIGSDLKDRTLGGSAVALAIGLVAALWAGLRLTLAGQRAMDQVWDVPRRARSDFLTSRLRALVTLVVLGGLNVAVTTAIGLIVGGVGEAAVKVAGFLLSVLLDVLLFWAVFRLLTSRTIATRRLLPGIVLAAVAWVALQTLGGIYVNHFVISAHTTYGFFAIVIGVLSWLALGASALLYAAEANVVRARRLWPRSLMAPITDADRQAVRDAASAQARRVGERIEVTFDGHDRPAD